MGEVMITRRGTLGGDDEHFGQKRHFIRFVQNTEWVVPNDAINNEFNVICFGKGYSYSADYEASSGFFNNGKFSLIPGEKININIGNDHSDERGVTSFGSYLLANSGSGQGGGSSSNHIKAYQFGGGTGSDGGVWGGGGTFGNGGMYGGGGTGSSVHKVYTLGGRYGGNGSNMYHTAIFNEPISKNVYDLNENDMINLYKKYVKYIKNYDFGENGTNTIGWTNVDKDIYTGEYITGPGLAKTTFKRYINVHLDHISNYQVDVCVDSEAVGGGGFGGSSIGSFYLFRKIANEKNFDTLYYVNYENKEGLISKIVKTGYDPITTHSSYMKTIGGGGYGGNAYGTGGAGYGKGADTYGQGGGAGYFTPSMNEEAAGWGIYGTGYAHSNIQSQGICTVEYYTWE